ncbi:MAG TPA: signal peptidase I [Opitutaceae bacterium]|nr:signal peptidase I [Opitutaceae bacterium]
MFGFFDSQDTKMRANARNWLELADKVWHYRRDQLSDADARELRARIEGLRQQVAAREEAAKLKLGIEALEPVLQRLGGKVYPKTSLVENVEFFLIAAIVIIGIRTYFVQPFKIPTNSMWPSYYGMTPEVYKNPAEHPGPVMQALRFVTLGARNHTLTAPASGPVEAEFFYDDVRLAYEVKPGHTWLVIPTDVKEYTFYVGGSPVTVQVPMDFDFDWAVRDAWFGGSTETLTNHLRQIYRQNSAAMGVKVFNQAQGQTQRILRAPLGFTAKQGTPFFSFDLRTGDQLFVDRMSYHFVRPSVGDGFVFNTRNLVGRIEGPPSEQYYIKRLVGVPGDTLEIKNFTLYRNGRPIEGAAAFGKNARREGDYVGYRNLRSLSVGQTMTVPPDSFLALGDNSANSQDGRYWGFVPAKDAVGRPLFIYFPFTRRWGPAR